MSQAELCARIAQTLATAPIHDSLGYAALAHLKLPGPDYYEVLRLLHLSLTPKLYVEIGVREGRSLGLAARETRCIAIDPAPQFPEMRGGRLGQPPWKAENVVLAVSTSDAFFAVESNREKCRGFDLAFIDGDHSFEQAARDFAHLEELAKPSSIICIHDVIPMDARTATPKAETSFHTGDVWRLMAGIIANRPDLCAFTVACPPTGLGIVGGFGGSAWNDGEEVREAGLLRLYELDMDWDVLAHRLKIVRNEGSAIGAAFLKKAAA